MARGRGAERFDTPDQWGPETRFTPMTEARYDPYGGPVAVSPEIRLPGGIRDVTPPGERGPETYSPRDYYGPGGPFEGLPQPTDWLDPATRFDPQGYPYAIPVDPLNYNVNWGGIAPVIGQQTGGVIGYQDEYQTGGEVGPGNMGAMSAVAMFNAVHEQRLKEMKLHNEMEAKRIQLMQSQHDFKKTHLTPEMPTSPVEVQAHRPHRKKPKDYSYFWGDYSGPEFQTGGVAGETTREHQPPDIFGRRQAQEQIPQVPPPMGHYPAAAGMQPQEPQGRVDPGIGNFGMMRTFQEGGFVQDPALPPDNLSGPILDNNGMVAGKYAMREGEIVIPPELAHFVSIQPGAEKYFKPEIVRALGGGGGRHSPRGVPTPDLEVA